MTVNNMMHLAEARATLIRADRRKSNPEVTFDLTSLFGKNIKQANRTFSRTGKDNLRIRDEVVFSPQTNTLTWQMMTQAEVKVKKNQIVLNQDGQELYLHIVSEEPFEVNVIKLSPPPLPYDKDIPELQRIEITWKRKSFEGDSGQVVVDLSTNATQGK